MSQPRQGVSRPHGDTPDELENYRQVQYAEYSQWVASQDIFVGTALAYRQGDPVPASNVLLHSYDKMNLVEPAKSAEPVPTKSVPGNKTTPPADKGGL